MENTKLNNAVVETVEDYSKEVVETATKKSNKTLKTCVISTIVAALATGGYIIYRKFKAKKTEEVEISEEETVENEAEEK